MKNFVGRLEAEGQLDEAVIRSFRERISGLPFNEDGLVGAVAADEVFAGHPDLVERLGQEWVDSMGDELDEYLKIRRAMGELD